MTRLEKVAIEEEIKREAGNHWDDVPDYVWVGFDQDGEPKQAHPVKPHGDLVGFEWRMFYPAEHLRAALERREWQAYNATLRFAETLTREEFLTYMRKQVSP